MNKLFLLLLVVACSTAPQARLTPYPFLDGVVTRPTVFNIKVNMIEPNLYVTVPDNVYIQTKNCIEEANQEFAVLMYEQYGYENRIDFSSGGVCKVTNIYSNPND